MRKFSKWITIGLCILAFGMTWGLMGVDWEKLMVEIDWVSALSTVIVTGGILWGIVIIFFGMVDSL